MGFEEQLHEFEDTWQERWQEAEIFEPDPDNRDKFFITVAYPYPSGGMHIGHVGTYTLPDVFARFHRMLGKNVLFPMAWHVTGTPIIGAANRLKDGEEKQLRVLRDTYNVPEEDLQELETPMGYASYFIENSYKKNMKDLGFSVDWRREFTTNDERYNKFIQWQYRTLREKGLVKKGKHPTKYCTVDKNPVTTHDLLEGEDAEQQEYTLVRFRQDEKILPMATLRPETVFGVTHALVNPEATYVNAKVDGEHWIIADEAVEKLEHQSHDVIVQQEFEGEQLVGQTVTNPVNGKEVMLLPATFVDPDSATGIVMSVPGHAPYDWISLKELQEDDARLDRFDLNKQRVKDITPISIIDVDGYGKYPAKEICEENGITKQSQADKLEEATEEIYKKEFHTGTLNDSCGEFAGQQVQDVKDKLIQVYRNDNTFAAMWDFSEDVICRCGGKVIVAKADTWFLEYGSKAWKDTADNVLNQLETIPENTREDYAHTINWLESWPCIRNFGLGTKLPFDDEFVVEPLSDSTIYMAYYTIKHLIDDIDPEKLTQEFFDYVFRGKGPVSEVVDKTSVSEEKLKEVRDSFEYWYPLDWRTSANELVQNHLTFFMYHHGAIFDKKHWPNGIAAWGLGLLEGKKMSSSKGHVVLPEDAIERHGADTVRFFMFASREPWQDFDWRRDEVREYKKKLRSFYHRSLTLYDSGEDRAKNRIDRYVISELQQIIHDTKEAMQEFQTRKAALRAFFDLNNVINWYRQRTDTVNTTVINQVVEAQIKMMAPFIPHICAELWDQLGKDSLVATETWPEHSDELIDKTIEYGEQLVKRSVNDVREIGEMVDSFDQITLVVAADWKRTAVTDIKEHFADNDGIDIGALMGRFSSNEELRPYMDDLSDLVQQYAQNPGDLPDTVLDSGEERSFLKEAEAFFENEFGAGVEVVSEQEADHEKAARARPGKPAIILE